MTTPHILKGDPSMFAPQADLGPKLSTHAEGRDEEQTRERRRKSREKREKKQQRTIEYLFSVEQWPSGTHGIVECTANLQKTRPRQSHFQPNSETSQSNHEHGAWVYWLTVRYDAFWLSPYPSCHCCQGCLSPGGAQMFTPWLVLIESHICTGINKSLAADGSCWLSSVIRS
jgi:hypothetical protein